LAPIALNNRTGTGAAVSGRPTVSGTGRVPADKSITHRALLIGAISDGPVAITNWLDAGDTRSTLAAVRALGVRVDQPSAGQLIVHGRGLRGLRAEGQTIDVGNAGTLLRLICGVLAGQSAPVRLDGDPSIRRRPMDRIAEPLGRMGVRLSADRAPLVIEPPPDSRVRAIDHVLPVASAQAKSAVLLAGLFGDGPTSTTEPAPSRDHTETMLADAGVRVDRDGLRATVHPPEGLRLPALEVPGDPSSAAFVWAAAALLPGSHVTVRGVVTAPSRTGLLAVLERMGCGVVVDGGDVTVLAPDVLHAVTVEGAEIPATIDELPLVGLLGALAEGETLVRDAAELRVKESDRIGRLVENLRRIGADAVAEPDGFRVHGSGGRQLPGGELIAYGDHRLAMLGAVADLVSRGGVAVDEPEAADISFPGFRATLDSLLRR
jgi:3-phosphoshikimate 1-carboxyvinyltransferase